MKRISIALLISILVCVSGYCQTTSPCTFYESDLPKIFDFENDFANEAPECWTVLTSATSQSVTQTTTYPIVKYSSSAVGNVLCLYKSGNSIAMPCFAGDISQMQISFYFKTTESNTDYLEIGIQTDLNNNSTYTPIDTIIASEYTYTSYYGPLIERTIKFNKYTITDTTANYYVVFKTGVQPNSSSLTNFWEIADITFDYTPSCQKAENITIDNLTDTSITISFSQPDTVNSWTVCYRQIYDYDTSAYIELEIDTTTFTLTDLEDQTTYKFYIKTNCWPPAISDSLTFKTHCSAIYIDDENTWIEEFTDDADCWSFPEVLSQYYYESWNLVNGYGGYIWANYDVNVEAISPMLDISNVNVPMVKVSYKSKTTIKIYYRTSSLSDWVYLADLDPTNNNTKTDSCILDNPSEGYQIKFQNVATNNYGGDTYIYSVEVYNVDNPSICYKPNNIKVESTTSSATITWSQIGDNASWIVYYKESVSDTYTASDTLYTKTFSFLTSPNTSYDIYIQALCNSNAKSNVESFVTPCSGLVESDLPKVWNFEYGNIISYSSSNTTYTLPQCWTQIGSFYNKYILTDNTWGTWDDAYEGSKCLSLSDGAFAILTPLDTSLNVSNLQLSFYAKTRYSYSIPSELSIGVMTDPTDSTTFTPTITLNTDYSYHHYTIPIVYNGTQTASYIALRGRYDVCIDSLVLSIADNCTPPFSLKVNKLSNSSGTLSWTQAGNNTSQWKVFYKQANQTVYDSTNVLDEMSYTFSDLDPNTSYDVYVKAFCGNNEITSETYTFTTYCDPLTIDDLPYFTNFDSDSTDSVPPCWVKVTTTFFAPSAYPRIQSDDVYSYSDNNSLEMGPNSAIALRSYQGDVSNLQLSFYLKRYGSGSIIIGVMTDLEDSTTFTPIDTIENNNSSYIYYVDYTLIEKDFTTYTPNPEINDYYIVLMSTGLGYSTWYIDDLKLDKRPNCVKPDSVKFSDLADTTVEISWTQSDTNTTWKVYYKKSTDSVYLEELVTADPYLILTNLEPLTTYDVYVATICDSTSPSTTLYSFKTLCSSEELWLSVDEPYIEDFETYEQYDIPDCWTIVLQSGYDPMYVQPKSYWNYAYSGENSFYIHLTMDNIIALREFANNLEDVRVQFYYKSSGTIGELTLGYVTDVTNKNTFVPLTTIKPNKEWSLYTIDLGAFSNELQGIDNARLAFSSGESSYSNSFYIDSLVLSLSPSCTLPTNIQTSQTNDTITISWYSTASSFNIIIKDDTDSTFVTQNNYTSTTFSTTALDPNSAYTVYVSSICSNDTLTSDYSFTTNCAKISYNDIPMTWNFENNTYSVDYYTYPKCWNINDYYPMVTTVGGGSNHYLYFSTFNNTIYATLPQIDITNVQIDTLTLSFSAYSPSYAAVGSTMCIGVMTDPNNDSTFTLVDSVQLSTSSHTYNIPLSTYTGNGSYIAFMSNDIIAYMDNVKLEFITPTIDTIVPPTPCNKPTSLNVSSTSNSITLQWSGTADKYDIQLSDNEIQTITTNTYTFTDLYPNTIYTVKVRSVCDDTVSNWTKATIKTADSSSLIDVVNNNIDVLLYPNPTTTNVSLEIKNLNENADIFITDINGKTIYKTTYTPTNSFITLPTNNYNAGVYYIKIVSGNIIKTVSLIKN
jgi:hypothetical protein